MCVPVRMVGSISCFSAGVHLPAQADFFRDVPS